MSDFITALECEIGRLEAELQKDPRYRQINQIRDLLAQYGAMLSLPKPAATEQQRQPAKAKKVKKLATKKNVGGRASQSGRPADLPPNTTMMIAAIQAAGHPLTGPEILKFVREKYWAKTPDSWTSNLFYAVGMKRLVKLAGKRYGLPDAQVLKPDAPKIAQQAKRPTLAAPSPISHSFEHKGREVILDTKEWRIASALGTIIGAGFMGYDRLLAVAYKDDHKPGGPARDHVTGIVLVANPKLRTVGLELKEVPKMGFSMQEVA